MLCARVIWLVGINVCLPNPYNWSTVDLIGHKKSSFSSFSDTTMQYPQIFRSVILNLAFSFELIFVISLKLPYKLVCFSGPILLC